MSLIRIQNSGFKPFARGLGFALIATVLLVSGGSNAAAADLEVKDIRIGVNSGSTRFVVELSDTVEPRIFGLPDPFRIVIDLPEVNFSLSEERIGDGAGLIEKLRYGLYRPGTSRFVLDLQTPSKVSSASAPAWEIGPSWVMHTNSSTACGHGFAGDAVIRSGPGLICRWPLPIATATAGLQPMALCG